MATTGGSNMTDAELEKIHAEINNMMASTLELGERMERNRAEANKLEREYKWYPAVVIIAAVVAGVAIAKLFL